MNAKVRAIAYNFLQELARSKVALVVLGVNVLILFPTFSSSSPRAVAVSTGMQQTVMGFLLFIVACRAFENDVNRRTLPGIMTHQVEVGEYLGGKTLALVLLYVAYSIFLLLLVQGVSISVDGAPSLPLFAAAVQNACTGIAWIVIGTAVGAMLASGGVAICTIIALTLARYFTTGNDVLRPLFYALSLASPPSSGQVPSEGFFPDSDALTGILVVLDNLLYAASVFIIGTALLDRRDIPTRGA